MNKENLRDIILECCNDVTFVYNGKKSGVTSTVKNYEPTFHAWHGDFTKDYKDIDSLMNDNIYSGKSINDLVDEVTINFV